MGIIFEDGGQGKLECVGERLLRITHIHVAEETKP